MISWQVEVPNAGDAGVAMHGVEMLPTLKVLPIEKRLPEWCRGGLPPTIMAGPDVAVTR